MDTTTYEQHTLDAEAAGDQGDWLQPEMHIQVEWLNGRPVGIELPSVVELTVVQTSPVMRGATKTASTKPAKLSNGRDDPGARNSFPRVRRSGWTPARVPIWSVLSRPPRLGRAGEQPYT